MINPFATSFLIAARLDRAIPPSAPAAVLEKPHQQRWDAPRHWREPSDEDD